MFAAELRMARQQFILCTLIVLGLAASSTALATPTAPGALTAVSASSTQINLSWTAATDSGGTITGYVIQRCLGSSCTNFVQVGSVASGSIYSDSGLTPASAYNYQVYATDATSSGPFSNVASATTLVTSISSGITYGYDALGRLVQANVVALNLVENYTYDSAGNLTSVTSSPAATLQVSNLSSPQGPVGGTVTIYGSGFSTTPASNTVDFNGKPATVISATSTQLIVTVPTGATTGPITVNTGSTTVSSSGSYTITAKAGAPTIASLLPPLAATGSTVTITGTGFQSVLANNQVQVNQTPATVVAATATSITFVVPSFDADTQNSSTFPAMSAPITVTTPYGSATSSTDLIVSAALIGAPTITTVGAAPVTFATPSAGVAQLLAFNATAGQSIELVANSQSTPGTIVGSVIAPNGVTAARLGFTASGQSLQVATPATGRYTVYFYPYGAQGGSVSYSVVGGLNGTLTLNGSPTTETLSIPGQGAQLTFNGTQGQNVALSFTNVTLSAAATLVLQSPNGATLLSQTLTTAGLILTPTLPESGTYTVLITPAAAASGAFTATLTSAATTTLALNQGAQSFTLAGTTPLTLTFNASAGQIVTVTAAETVGASSTLTPSILQPDGTLLATTYRSLCVTCGTSLYYNLGPLTQTGTYSLVAQQTSTATNTFAVTLATPAVGSATVGAPAIVTLTQMGQAAAVAFQGVAGQYVSAALATSTALGSTGTLAILGPDGTTIASGITSNCSAGCNPQGVVSAGPLPATGTYTVLYQQSSDEPPGSGSLTITVLAPVTGTLTVGASNPVVVSSGQSFEESFAGSAGQTLSVTLQSTGAGAPTNGTATILDPNGAPLASTSFNGHNGYPTTLGFAILNIGPLRIGGSYTVLLQQATSSAGLGAGTVEVTPELSASGLLTMGSAANVSLSAGQGFAETFSGTAGQYLSLAVGSQGASAPTAGIIELLSPTGAVVSTTSLSGNCYPTCNGEADLNVGPLPTTGQYTLVFQQANSFYSPPGSGSITITPEAAIQGTLTLGTPAMVTLAAGQGVQNSFSGTTGQYATVTVSESASLVQGANVSVLSPSGNTVATGAFTPTCSTTCSGTSSLNVGPLPSSGTYTVLLQQITPAYGFGAGSVTLTVTGNTANGGTSQNLTTSTAGQSAQFTFTAAALQTLELAFSNMVLTPSSVTTYTVQVLDPSGNIANNGSCTSSTTCVVQLYNTVTGTYTVTVTPGGTATMNVTASVGPLQTSALTLGTPLNLNLSEPGENASLIFTATAGQDLVLAVSGMTTVPAGSYYIVYVYDPTSNLIAASYPTSAATLNLPIALTGTYTVSVTTMTSTTASMQLTLLSGATASVPSTGTGVNISTSLASENAYYTFSGTFGQSLTLVLGNVVETPAGGSPYLNVNGPSGANWAAGCTSSCVLHMPTLPATGTYAATLWPQAQATLSATAYLTPDVTGTMTVGTPLNLTLSETGQSASLAFAVTGEAPQTLALYINNLSATPSGAAYTATVSNFNQRDATVVSGQVTANGTFNLPNLAPGTYVVTLTPTAPATASLQVTLEPQNGGTLNQTSTGSGSVFTTPAPGENSYFTFAATAGQSFALAFSNISFSPSSVTNFNVSVSGPSYSNGAQCYSSSPSSCEIALQNLPQTGIYQVTVTPSGAATMTFTATLSADVSGTLTAGTTKSVPLNATGQDSWLTFNVTAGQTLGLYVGGITSTPANSSYTVTVYNSAGTSVATASTTSGTTFSLANLSAGAYHVLITPATPATATMQATLSANVTGTLTPGTPKSLTFAAMGQGAWLTFSAIAGQNLAVNVSGISSSPANTSYTVTVYNSAATSVASGSTTTGTTLNLPSLAAGTYHVLIAPLTPATATMQATLEPQTGGALSLTSSGGGLSYTTPAAGQDAYFSFTATAGESLSLALSGFSLTPSSVAYAYVTVTGPSYSTYTFCYMSNGGCVLPLNNLPAAGTYAVTVTPEGAATMSFVATLSAELTGTLTISSPLNVNLAATGEEAFLTFTATSGQTVALDIGGVSSTPANLPYTVTVYNSAGTSVASGSATTGGTTLNLPSLAAGTYNVWIAPVYPSSATMPVTLEPQTGGALLLTSSGSGLSYTTPAPSQNAYFSFTAAAGENLSLTLSGFSLTPSSVTYAFVTVTGPSYSTYTFCYVSNGGCELPLNNLPTAGAYTVTVTPEGAATMNFVATLSADVTNTLTAGTPQTVPLAAMGQGAWLTFSATAGQTLALNLSGISSTPANTPYSVTVYNAAGTNVASGSTTTGGTTLNLPSLAAGTYNVWISPEDPSSATMQVTLEPQTGGALLLTSSGSGSSYTTPAPSQDAYFSFTATAGESLSLTLTGFSLTPSSVTYAFVTVTGPSYSTYTFCYVSNGGCVFPLNNLPAAGTYTVTVTPEGAATMSFVATLSADVTGTLTAGTPQSVPLAAMGQVASLTFGATAGQTLALNLSGISSTPANATYSVTVCNAAGTSVASGSTTTGSITLNLPNLAAGTYTVWISPVYPASATMQVVYQ
jgi:large repetitive protein